MSMGRVWSGLNSAISVTAAAVRIARLRSEAAARDRENARLRAVTKAAEDVRAIVGSINRHKVDCAQEYCDTCTSLDNIRLDAECELDMQLAAAAEAQATQ